MSRTTHDDNSGSKEMKVECSNSSETNSTFASKNSSLTAQRVKLGDSSHAVHPHFMQPHPQFNQFPLLTPMHSGGYPSPFLPVLPVAASNSDSHMVLAGFPRSPFSLTNSVTSISPQNPFGLPVPFSPPIPAQGYPHFLLPDSHFPQFPQVHGMQSNQQLQLQQQDLNLTQQPPYFHHPNEALNAQRNIYFPQNPYLYPYFSSATSNPLIPNPHAFNPSPQSGPLQQYFPTFNNSPIQGSAFRRSETLRQEVSEHEQEGSHDSGGNDDVEEEEVDVSGSSHAESSPARNKHLILKKDKTLLLSSSTSTSQHRLITNTLEGPQFLVNGIQSGLAATLERQTTGPLSSGGKLRPCMLKCPVANCDRKFRRQHILEIHIKTHNDPEGIMAKPYACSWTGCEWRFTRSDDLTRHYRTHTGDRPFPCNFCNKRFRRLDHLKSHSLVHAENRAALDRPLKSHPKSPATKKSEM
jgi:hypothetical protein